MLVTGLLIIMVVYFILIVISSIPLWLASKMLGLKKSGFINAVVATVAGGIVTVVIYAFILSITGSWILSIILGFIAYLWVIKNVYDISWGKAALLYIVSIITVIVLAAIIALILLILAVPVVFPHPMTHMFHI